MKSGSYETGGKEKLVLDGFGAVNRNQTMQIHVGHGKDFDLYFEGARRLLQVLIRSMVWHMCRGGLCIRRPLVWSQVRLNSDLDWGGGD